MRVEKLADVWCVEVWDTPVQPSGGLLHMRLVNHCRGVRKELFLSEWGGRYPIQDHVETAIKALATFGVEFVEPVKSRETSPILGKWYGVVPISPEQATMLLKMDAQQHRIGYDGRLDVVDDGGPGMWEQTIAALPCGDA